MIEWDKDLNSDQKTAARHEGMHARLLAGPGTGKTLTLARRILWLLTQLNIQPNEILALTFTRAAASELRCYVKDNLEGKSLELPKVSTLHSFALRQLLRNALLTQLPQPLRIADDYEERQIIIGELSDLIGKDVRKTKKLLDELSADWQRLTADSSDWELRFPVPLFLGAWKEHREIYGYTLRAELLYQLKRVLEEHGESFNLEGPPKYMLIDEYQDLNACDLSVIKSLAALGSEIYCAGDDDQSIYGFRFANPEGIRRFTVDYNPSTLLELGICQRCCKEILDYGLFVAKQDIRRIDKPIRPKDEAKRGVVKVLRFPSQNEEAEGIAGLCFYLIYFQGISPDEILILLRTDRNNKFSNPLRDALTEKGIPVGTVSNPLEPLNHEQGREFLCLLRLVCNREDHLAWRTILDLGNRRIGKQTFSELYEMARKGGIKFSGVLQEVKSNPNILPRIGSRVAQKVKDIENLLNEFGIPEAENLIEWIEAIANKVIRDDEEKKEVLALFMMVRELGKSESLEELLKVLNVSLGDKEQEREKGKVAIMTMHQAKGLSADAVIVAAAEDEYIPGKAIGEERDDERRLLFVSLTRARKYLYVTSCQWRTGQQRYTGRTAGKLQRTFTEFLSGGPHTPGDGQVYIMSLIDTI
ncbi:MAG: ATP-dependent DNA helicase UvrD1 [candidate division WS2 bacterium]|nr:ATP-dependent DNA helicase UvrD1 [Candidatus Lithacetigena glycinireducens]